MQPVPKLVLVLAFATCAGCASAPVSSEPDELLRPRVAAWERTKTGDFNVRDLVKDTEVHDPDVIRHQIQELSLVYPGHVPTLMANAIVCYDSKMPEDAQQYLDRVFKIRPAHPEAAILRARIATEEGNTGFARKLLEEQVHLTPDHAGLREALAGVYFVLDRFDDARVTLDAAGRLGAPDWRVSFNRGLIAEATGNIAQAREFYADALRQNEECAGARSRLRGLDELTPSERNPPRRALVEELQRARPLESRSPDPGR